MKEIFGLKKQKLTVEYSFAVLYSKVVKKRKRRFMLELRSTRKMSTECAVCPFNAW